MTTASHTGGLQAAWGSLIRKIQLFVYIHFPHSDYFINCPAFISSLPIPPNNQLLYPEQQTHHRSFVDSKDLLPSSQRAAILWWLGSGKLQSHKSYLWLAGGPSKSLSSPKKWSLTPQMEAGDLGERSHSPLQRRSTLVWISTSVYFIFISVSSLREKQKAGGLPLPWQQWRCCGMKHSRLFSRFVRNFLMTFLITCELSQAQRFTLHTVKKVSYNLIAATNSLR